MKKNILQYGYDFPPAHDQGLEQLDESIEHNQSQCGQQKKASFERQILYNQMRQYVTPNQFINHILL